MGHLPVTDDHGNHRRDKRGNLMWTDTNSLSQKGESCQNINGAKADNGKRNKKKEKPSGSID